MHDAVSAFLRFLRPWLYYAVSIALGHAARTSALSMCLSAAAAGVLAALQAKRESLQRRAEILLKSKGEFQEIARCL